MHFPRLRKVRAIYRSLFALSLIFVLFVSSPGAVAQRSQSPKSVQLPEEYLNGMLAGLEDSDSGISFNSVLPLLLLDATDVKDSKTLAAIVQKMLKTLNDKKQDMNDRAISAMALVKLSDSNSVVIQEIVKILRDTTEDINFRWVIISIINQWNYNTSDSKQQSNAIRRRFAPEVVSILKDQTQDASIRIEVAEIVVSLGDRAKPYIPDIARLLQDSSNLAIPGRAALVLSTLGDPAKPYISDMLNILRDETLKNYSYSPQKNAAAALGKLGNAAKPYIPDLLIILKDKKRYVEIRQEIVSTLGKIGTIPDILTILKDKKEDVEVRRIAASALARLGAGSDLLNFIQDKSEDIEVRKRIMIPLEKLGYTGKNFIPNLLTFIQDKQQDIDSRSLAADALLRNLGDATKPYVPTIANLLKDKSQDRAVRGKAARVLINLGDEGKPFIADIMSFIKEKISSPSDWERDFGNNIEFLSNEASANWGDAVKPFIQDIANVLRDKKQNPYVRGPAGYMLISLGDSAKPYIPDMIDFVQDKTHSDRSTDGGRWGVASSLTELGDAIIPFIPNLRTIINDQTEESSFRVGLARSLIDLGDPGKVIIPDMVAIIRDKAQPFEVRSRMSRALGSFGDVAAPYIPDILNLIKTTSYNNGIREAERLRDMFPLSFSSVKLKFEQVLPFVDMAESVKQEPDTSWRLTAYVQSNGSDEIKHLLKWVGKPQPGKVPSQLNHEDGVKTLTLFAKTWEFSQNLPDLRRSLIQPIANVTQMVQWKPSDKTLLSTHYQNLITVDTDRAKVLKDAIDRLNLE